MKIVYAPRRMKLYPHHGPWQDLPPREIRPAYFAKLRKIGFEGLELRPGMNATQATELRRELADEGVPCAAVGFTGGFTTPDLVVKNRQRFEDAIQLTSWLGASVIDIVLVSVPVRPEDVGEPTSSGGGRTATDADYEITAKHLQGAAGLAHDLGVNISVQLHHHTIADNSRGLLRLLDMIDRPNVGANPDIANVYWAYDRPDESCEEAILALAPRASYWHCKQLARLYVPALQRAMFLRPPLPDGDVDYQFAIATMHDAGYTGMLSIKGCPEGDHLRQDGRSVAYCREILAELGA